MAGAEKQSAFSAAPTEAARELDFFEEVRERKRSIESKIAAGRTRILFLNRSFWPDREATGQFLTELCDDLSTDHEVTIVAGPSYHTDDGNSRGFRLWSREDRGKITVMRTRGPRF
jgi:hypothetical protein